MYKNITFLVLIIFNISLIYAQDSTVKIVGPGFKYYSVRKPSGPYNFKILEIDITQPKNKIETVLAKDVLGTGFEKTSSMAMRSSYSKHIVIGAVNGDFFGISYPSNPFTFLTGSMVKDRQYTQGKTSKRDHFGVLSNNKPIFENLGFSGTFYAKNDSSKSLNGINDTVNTNYLILYNQYFGLSTKTNSTVTELRLKPIENFQVNATKKFVVLQKSSGGNMTINKGDYILSGNGTAQTYLDALVNIGDTVKIRIGTNPNKGNVESLMGGGPKIVDNGVVVSGIDAVNKHPRTAVGINQDSTKVFFLTVDGRQEGFSIGMTLVELANYMIGIGCYHALNLDGGGSTTMVIRNSVVNSPSDAGGERSCGNALLAVCEMAATDSLKSFKINPRNVYIDSTQTKKLTLEGTDTWGYPVELLPTEVNWQVIGIPGIVDSSGFLIPFSSGTGIIIASVGELKDTITFTVTKSLIPVWSFCDFNNNLPPWLSPTGNTERGLAYGYINGNHRLYVVNRPNISILNALTGDVVGQLSVAGVSGGTYTVNDVEVSEDGIIIAANLTTAANTSPFRVYKWTSESANAELLFEYNGTANRLGDKITVVGALNNNSAVIYASANSLNKVYKWTMSNGTFNPIPVEITLSGITNSGTNPSVAPLGTGNSNFYFNGNSIVPKLYTSTGALLGTVPNNLIDSRSNAIRYFEFAGKKYIVSYQYGFPNENAKVLDVTKGPDSAKLVETTPSLGDNLNSTGASGDVAYRYYGNGIYIIYVLATNNGIGAHQLNLDTTLVNISENIYMPKEFRLYQNYPNPFNPSTTIKFEIPQYSKIKLSVYDILGREIRVLVDDFKNAGQYQTEFNTEGLTSGILFYSLESSKGRITRKMILLK